MIVRELPASEWDRLAATDLGDLAPRLDPSRTTILVVEDADRIVGHVATIRTCHADGAWVHPDYRGRVAVLRHLWRGLKQMVRAQGFDRMVLSADTEQMAHMFRRGVPLGSQEFVVCLKKS